jgi:hypothetical protein
MGVAGGYWFAQRVGGWLVLGSKIKSSEGGSIFFLSEGRQRPGEKDGDGCWRL